MLLLENQIKELLFSKLSLLLLIKFIFYMIQEDLLFKQLLLEH